MHGFLVNWHVPPGNDRFGDVVPFEEVCLGAEQHERPPYCLGTGSHTQRDLRYDAANDLPENAAAVRRYLEQERAFQEELLASLRPYPHYAPYATEEVVSRNRQLVGIWDALSLAICFGRTHQHSWEQVPTTTSSTTLSLTAREDDPTQLIITPWPFRRQQLTLVYEGRYLTETFSNEAKMREALSHAPWVTLQTVLFPNEAE